MTEQSIGALLIAWAEREPSISGLVMIGSRARPPGEFDAADEYSDWDFQVITESPHQFADARWLRAAGLPPPEAYVFRPGRLGQASKASMVFATGEMDVVIISGARLRRAKVLNAFGVLGLVPAGPAALASLAVVLRPGYRVLKGAEKWEGFFEKVVRVYRPAPLSNTEICALADGFVVDYVSALRKIQRGELLAAQRWLHHYLADTNFRLLVALEERQGRRALPDARRLEKAVAKNWLDVVKVPHSAESTSLRDAVEQSAQGLRALMRELVGEEWEWPDLTLRLRVE